MCADEINVNQESSKGKFLVNMAIIKVNWDASRKDILDNYLPLVGYAIKLCEGDVVALEDVEAKLRDVAEFRIPRGAIVALLKRAAKPAYGYVRKEEHKYVKAPEKLAKLDYEKRRDDQTRRFNGLKMAFRSFCSKRYNIDVSEGEASEYFFEILYEMAPSLYKNLQIVKNGLTDEGPPEITRKYLVSRFVQHVVSNDPISFSALEAFVRGAMLTDTFYYSSPQDIPKRFQNTTVFFDTSFLLRLLGYSDESRSAPCVELHEMLNGMGVKLRCFRKTFGEIHRILYAVMQTIQEGRMIVPRRPGDVSDHFAQKGFSASDVELIVAKLEDSLRKRGIYIQEHPPHEKLLTVAEAKLDEYISHHIKMQAEKSRYHDIDCLTSIFRLRKGRAQMYLESCEAIFITTNTSLAKGATEFFNDEYGVSNAPVCMSDQVFTTLVWLKAVNKIPDLPKERLVANCYAALNPSEELWQKYVKEADDLLKRHQIDEQDYAVLVNSFEARMQLMEATLGDHEVSLEGTVPEVLARAKAHYLGETKHKLEAAERKLALSDSNILAFLTSISNIVRQIVKWGLLVVWASILVVAMLVTSPDDLSVFARIRELDIGSIVRCTLFLVLVVFSFLNLVFGVRVLAAARRASELAAHWIKHMVEYKFFSSPPVTASKTADNEG